MAHDLRFYRDKLGIPEQVAFATDGADRVAILQAGSATTELATHQHAGSVDAAEGVTTGAADELRLRIALEVDDTYGVVERVTAAGYELLAPATETPFRSRNARIEGPAGWQITFFQELETLETRRGRPGFSTDEARAS